MPVPVHPSREERLLIANRRLCVLEELFAVAAVDPDGRPFAGPRVSDFCLGVAELVRSIQDLLDDTDMPPSGQR